MYPLGRKLAKQYEFMPASAGMTSIVRTNKDANESRKTFRRLGRDFYNIRMPAPEEARYPSQACEAWASHIFKEYTKDDPMQEDLSDRTIGLSPDSLLVTPEKPKTVPLLVKQLPEVLYRGNSIRYTNPKTIQLPASTTGRLLCARLPIESPSKTDPKQQDLKNQMMSSDISSPLVELKPSQTTLALSERLLRPPDCSQPAPAARTSPKSLIQYSEPLPPALTASQTLLKLSDLMEPPTRTTSRTSSLSTTTSDLVYGNSSSKSVRSNQVHQDTPSRAPSIQECTVRTQAIINAIDFPPHIPSSTVPETSTESLKRNDRSSGPRLLTLADQGEESTTHVPRPLTPELSMTLPKSATSTGQSTSSKVMPPEVRPPEVIYGELNGSNKTMKLEVLRQETFDKISNWLEGTIQTQSTVNASEFPAHIPESITSTTPTKCKKPSRRSSGSIQMVVADKGEESTIQAFRPPQPNASAVSVISSENPTTHLRASKEITKNSKHSSNPSPRLCDDSLLETELHAKSTPELLDQLIPRPAPISSISAQSRNDYIDHKDMLSKQIVPLELAALTPREANPSALSESWVEENEMLPETGRIMSDTQETANSTLALAYKASSTRSMIDTTVPPAHIPSFMQLTLSTMDRLSSNHVSDLNSVSLGPTKEETTEYAPKPPTLHLSHFKASLNPKGTDTSEPTLSEPQDNLQLNVLSPRKVSIPPWEQPLQESSRNTLHHTAKNRYLFSSCPETAPEIVENHIQLFSSSIDSQGLSMSEALPDKPNQPSKPVIQSKKSVGRSESASVTHTVTLVIPTTVDNCIRSTEGTSTLHSSELEVTVATSITDMLITPTLYPYYLLEPTVSKQGMETEQQAPNELQGQCSAWIPTDTNEIKSNCLQPTCRPPTPCPLYSFIPSEHTGEIDNRVQAPSKPQETPRRSESCETTTTSYSSQSDDSSSHNQLRVESTPEVPAKVVVRPVSTLLDTRTHKDYAEEQEDAVDALASTTNDATRTTHASVTESASKSLRTDIQLSSSPRIPTASSYSHRIDSLLQKRTATELTPNRLTLSMDSSIPDSNNFIYASNKSNECHNDNISINRTSSPSPVQEDSELSKHLPYAPDTPMYLLDRKLAKQYEFMPASAGMTSIVRTNKDANESRKTFRRLGRDFYNIRMPAPEEARYPSQACEAWASHIFKLLDIVVTFKPTCHITNELIPAQEIGHWPEYGELHIAYTQLINQSVMQRSARDALFPIPVWPAPECLFHAQAFEVAAVSFRDQMERSIQKLYDLITINSINRTPSLKLAISEYTKDDPMQEDLSDRTIGLSPDSLLVTPEKPKTVPLLVKQSPEVLYRGNSIRHANPKAIQLPASTTGRLPCARLPIESPSKTDPKQQDLTNQMMSSDISSPLVELKPSQTTLALSERLLRPPDCSQPAPAARTSPKSLIQYSEPLPPALTASQTLLKLSDLMEPPTRTTSRTSSLSTTTSDLVYGNSSSESVRSNQVHQDTPSRAPSIQECTVRTQAIINAIDFPPHIPSSTVPETSTESLKRNDRSSGPRLLTLAIQGEESATHVPRPLTPELSTTLPKSATSTGQSASSKVKPPEVRPPEVIYGELNGSNKTMKLEVLHQETFDKISNWLEGTIQTQSTVNASEFPAHIPESITSTTPTKCKKPSCRSSGSIQMVVADKGEESTIQAFRPPQPNASAVSVISSENPTTHLHASKEITKNSKHSSNPSPRLCDDSLLETELHAKSTPELLDQLIPRPAPISST
ncbi:hypothetical protein RSAG8_06186, partial [Rhizoctonia solani AG-8 WAC10335]